MMNLLFCFTFGIILITLGFALKKPLQKLDYKKPFVRAWRLWLFLIIMGTGCILLAIILFVLDVTGNLHLSIKAI